MPSELTTASTWDRDLMYKRANAMGHEFYNLGVHVALGPVTGGPAGRSPLGGRGWENFSPDPYLTGVGSYYSVKGIQVRRGGKNCPANRVQGLTMQAGM